MKKTLFVGFAAAGLMAGASVAVAGGDHSQSSSSQTSSSPSASASASSQSSQLSGKIQSVDQQKKSVTIASDSGSPQDVKLGDNTSITKDGSSVSFSQLKPGDQVRASLDPSTHQATTLEIQSKDKK